MSRFIRTFLKAAIADIRYQYRCPTKSLTGSLLSRKLARDSKPLLVAVVEQLDIRPDDNILEIGYGRGEGLHMILERIARGEGTAFGLELSDYLTNLAEAEFRDELYEFNNLVLDKASELLLLPYTSSFLDGIFHVDVFYFWPTSAMADISHEFFRVLKPGKQIICGMDLKRLKRLEEWEILKLQHYDPMRYTEFLEPAGFQDIKMLYKKIDANGHECENSENAREVLLITARKPEVLHNKEDPEMVFKKLEVEIKEHLVAESMKKSLHGSRQTQREDLENKEMEKRKEELERMAKKDQK